jgi:hypothetical protein
MRSRLDAVRSKLPAFKSRLDQLENRAYPLVTYTVLDNFTSYALQDLDIAVPSVWSMTGVSGAAARCEPVRDPHSGAMAMKLTNASKQSPNVYGMFENGGMVTLKEGKTYTLGLWAKSDDPGVTSVPVNAGWSDRMALAATGGKWQRFAKTFTPAAGDTSFKFRVLLESVTSDLVVDDASLVEGDKAEAGKNLIANPSFEESWSGLRVARELPDMERMSARLEKGLSDGHFPPVPRWSGETRPTIDGPSFKDKSGRPIFFVGYGHFQQVRNDMEKFPAYGINIVQHGEMGPAQVWPRSETIADDTALNNLIDELDRAAKAGVAVDFLISPHYVPPWLFEKYPHLRKNRIDFFPWSIYAPEGRALVKRFCEYVIPKIKDKPALLSICLSNEPINWQEPDEFSTAAWRAWLKQCHGDIATLNTRWKSDYKSFDEIKQPNATDMAYGHKTGSVWCDFVRWNQEYFSAFHKDLGDMVHAVAPNLPVHVKSTTWHLYRSENILSGDDPTLLESVTQINGNDSVNLWSFNERAGDLIERGTTDFAQGWRENAIGYELQRCVHDAPVFNSENHLIFDRETRYVDPAHIRSALWMGAIHGQSATTMWVWEREKSNPGGDFAGSIMERASCAEAAGIVCHDLNRAAAEITAIQKEKPQVYLLQDNTAAVWDGKRYDDAFLKLFTALSFTGCQVGFVTERQLEQKTVTDVPALFFPNTVHLSDAAYAGLKTFKGGMIFYGEKQQLLTRNEYDQPREPHIAAQHLPLGKSWQETLHALATLVHPDVNVACETGPGSVQWQTVRTPTGTVINLYNAVHDPRTITIDSKNLWIDVLSGQHVQAGGKITLQPLEVRLLRAIGTQ